MKRTHSPLAALATLFAVVAVALALPACGQNPGQPRAAAQPGGAGEAGDPDPVEYGKKLDAAASNGRDFLLALHGKDPAEGGWGPESSMIGTNGLALNGLLRGRQPVQVIDERIRKTLEQLLQSQSPDGAWASPQRGVAVYETAVVLRALVAAATQNEEFGARRDVQQAIQRGRDYLLMTQVDAPGVPGNGGPAVEPDAAHGGWGYGGGVGSPNLGTTTMAVDALESTVAVLGEDDRIRQSRRKLQNFLRHCHNLREVDGKPYNSQTRLTEQGRVQPGNDGGAVYAPGSSHAGTTAQEGGLRQLRSYGSVTWSLLRLYHLSGVTDRNDMRIVKAWEWVTRAENFVFGHHPGMSADGSGGQYAGHYYYLFTAAHTLARMAERPTITDSRNEQHDWRRAIGDALQVLQLPDGGWRNTKNPAFWEGNPLVATAYALVALGHLE